MTQLFVHLIWWTFLALLFGGGWVKGGLLGCSMILLAVLAPFTYAPTPQNLFALYVWWLLPLLNKWRNWPSYQHFGIVIDGDCIEFASARGSGFAHHHNNSYWLRSTEFGFEGERVLVASLDRRYIKTKLPCSLSTGIIPLPNQCTAFSSDGMDQLDLTNITYSLLLGGRATVKLAILIAMSKEGIHRASRKWTVNGTEYDFKMEWDRVIS